MYNNNKHCSKCKFIDFELNCTFPSLEEFEQMVKEQNPITVPDAIKKSYWVFKNLWKDQK